MKIRAGFLIALLSVCAFALAQNAPPRGKATLDKLVSFEYGRPALKGRSSLRIAATLEYQACDDKVCFVPQSVPLAWTIALRPLDTERAHVRP